MSKKYDPQSRSHAIGVTTLSILAVMVAMGLYVLVDLGTEASQVNTAAVASSAQSIA